MSTKIFTQAHLPDIQKKQLCIDLLRELGVTTFSETDEGELIHSCCLSLGGHRNGDRNPSASLNWQKLVFSCFGCGHSGGLLWFISAVRGDDDISQSRKWLDERTYANQHDVFAVLELLRSIINQTPMFPQPIPSYDVSILNSWDTEVPHPYLTEGISELGFTGRMIPESTLATFRIGYDAKADRITIPIFYENKLVGWQARAVADGVVPKYKNSPDVPRTRVLYNHDPVALEAVLVESPMTVLRHHHHRPDMTASFGATVTDEQLNLLHNKKRVVLWFDHDTAGWNATRKAARQLAPYTSVWVVQWPAGTPLKADPGDLDDDVVDLLISWAVPSAVWHP